MQMWKWRLAGIAGGLLTGVPLVLALTACDMPNSQAAAETKTYHVTGDLAVMRDAEHGVTCWSRYGYTGTTLSCLPDWMLTPAQRKPVTEQCLIKDVGVSEACRLLLDPQGVAQ